MRRWPNIGLLSAHRLRRWPNSKSALGQRLMSAGWGQSLWSNVHLCLFTDVGQPLGFIFEGRDIPDSAFSASSSVIGDHQPYRARFGKYFDSSCAWVSGMFIQSYLAQYKIFSFNTHPILFLIKKNIHSIQNCFLAKYLQRY